MKLDFSNVSVLVVGDIILDRYLIGDVTRVSPEAPVPVVKFKKSRHTLGGAANVANNLVKLGCSVTIIGVIGNDSDGKIILELLKKNKINNGLLILKNYSTIIKTRVIGNDYQICRIDYENSKLNKNRLLHYLKSFFARNKRFDALIISDYDKGMINTETSQFLIERFRENKKIVVIDPKKSNWGLYSNATVLTPNYKELLQAAPYCPNEIKSIVAYGRELIGRYKIDNLLITRSEKGMLWVTPSSFINIGTEVKEVFDVSGAGDTVVATLVASLVKGFNIEQSLKFANVAAGITVSKRGTFPIEIKELLNKINEKPTS